LLDGYVIFVLGVAMPLVVAEFHIQPDVVGLIGASLVFGAVIGAGVGGPMADHLGRRKFILADMIIIGAGASISALARGPAMLFIGQLLVAAAITLVLLKGGSTQAWRLFLATEGAVAILFFVLRLSAPESPHWLMSCGKFAKAAEAFIRIIPKQREAVLRLTGDHEKLTAPVPDVTGGLSILFSRRYRARTALVTIPWFLMDIATYGVGLFTPAILGAIEIFGRTRGIAAHDFALVKGSAIIDLFLLVGFLLGVWMVPRFGRIRMQAVGFAGMAVGMFMLLAAVGLTNSTLHIPLVFAGFILFNLLMNAGPNSTTFTLAPILFPTQLRGTAGGFAAGVAKLGATLGVFLLPIVKEKFGVPSVLGIVSAVSLLGLVVTLILGREDTE